MKVLEVCVESMEDARLAVACGAGRIELCRDLSADGLTPEPHMLAEVASLPVPVMVMIRPRGGDFCYSVQEIDTMCRQIAAARVAGAAGVVTGVLTGNRQSAIGQSGLCGSARGRRANASDFASRI